MKVLVYMLNGQCSGICGGASFREERLTLAERGEMDILKRNDDDDDDDDEIKLFTIKTSMSHYCLKMSI